MEPGIGLHKASVFEKVPGGAPTIVAVALARLGMSVGLIARLGGDPFGHFVADTLAAEGVNTSQLGFESNAYTGIAFSSLTTEDERESIFLLVGNAGLRLSPGHINPDYVKNTRAIVYDSAGLTAEPCRSGVLKALAIARDASVLQVYDASLCLSLWGSESEARYGMALGLERADIVRLGLDGMELLSGTRDPLAGTEKLWAMEPIRSKRMRLMIVTLGRKGCAYRTAEGFGQVPGYTVDTLDPTGAGNGFLAGLLAELIQAAGADQEKRLAEFDFTRDDIERSLRFANAAGALTTTQHGTIAGLPTRPQVDSFLGNTPNRL